MANVVSANGSTVTFPDSSTSVGILANISYAETCSEINKTGMGDNVHTFEGGIPNITVTVSIKGVSTTVTRSTGTLGVTFSAGTVSLGSLNASLGSFILLNKNIGAPIDGETTTELTFRPT